jgi:D-lactate dehydrogenase
MKKIAMFDAKSYDKVWFDKLKGNYGIDITYFEEKLSPETAKLAKGFDGVCGFVNDDISAGTMDVFVSNDIGVLAMRCAGFDRVDLKSAEGRVKVFRVPAYSPNAVAEHAMALLLCLNRNLHKAYNLCTKYDFRLDGLMGFDLVGKTVGIIGTGKIGQVFVNICKGFGMNILAYDLFPADIPGIKYVELPELFAKSDVISLHCPMTPENRHIINKENIALMKEGVYIINTSRGGLVNGADILDALNSGKVGGAGIDVYEFESGVFFEDRTKDMPDDKVLKALLAHPNVLITAHQAYLTEEALKAIAEISLQNLADFFNGKDNSNEVTL